MKRFGKFLGVLSLVGVFGLMGCGSDSGDNTIGIEDVGAESERTANAETKQGTEKSDESNESVSLEAVDAEDMQMVWDMVVMVDDVLYYGTEKTGSMGDAQCVAGQITSTVSKEQTPTKDGESNFGSIGSSYTEPSNGTIMVLLNNEEWHIFESEEAQAQYEKMTLMVDGILFYGTAQTTINGDAESVAGHITSTVNENELPTQNGQSNFDCIGNPYTIGASEGEIAVLLSDQCWHTFKFAQ